MKNYKKIEFKKSAEKFLKSRTRKEQVLILSKIYKLPGGTDVIKMGGYQNRYRLRVGDYRIIFEMRDEIDDSNEECIKFILVILVVEIGNRRDVYK